MNTDQTPVLCLAGPTASGKSAISRAIASQWPVEIINVDSATIYRGMDIGTAKPDSQERAAVTHHLLDILEPTQSYSAAQFRDDAWGCIEAIRARGRIPLLCGGTMLYFKVLRDGIDDLPSADAGIRAQIFERAQLMGWPAMHEELSKVDPKTAARLAPNDSQRIGRALEIFESTGTPMSAYLTQSKQPSVNCVRRAPLLMVSLEPSARASLHSRIEHRFDEMLAAGLLKEVQQLYRRPDLHANLPSMRCVGYRQLWDHLEGKITLSQARENAIAATRQLAKRQLTWLRSMPERHTVDCLDPHASQKVLSLMMSAAPGLGIRQSQTAI
jgi:tRNA dimethylallyltransferase